MTDPRIAAAIEAVDGHGTSYIVQRGHIDEHDIAALIAAVDAYDDAHPLEALAAYRERVERDVRAAVAAALEAEADLCPPDSSFCGDPRYCACDVWRNAIGIVRGDE